MQKYIFVSLCVFFSKISHEAVVGYFEGESGHLFSSGSGNVARSLRFD